MVGKQSVRGHPWARQGMAEWLCRGLPHCVARSGGCSKRVLTMHRGVSGSSSWRWWLERAHRRCWYFCFPAQTSRKALGFGCFFFFSIILLHPSRLNSVVSPV